MNDKIEPELPQKVWDVEAVRKMQEARRKAKSERIIRTHNPHDQDVVE
jgi:hypothetical protein